MSKNTTVEYKPNSPTPNVSIHCDENGRNSHDNEKQANDKNATSFKKGTQPKMFERSSKKWWNPSFDSKLLQTQYLKSSLLQVRALFQQSLLFICLSCITWTVYNLSLLNTSAVNGWLAGAIWAIVLAVICLVLLIFTKQKFHQKYTIHVALLLICLLMISGLLAAYFTREVMSSAGSFVIAAEIILLTYIISPLPVPVTFLVAVIFTIIHEVLLHVGQYQLIILGSPFTPPQSVIGRLCLLIAIHIVGLHALLNIQILRYSTFGKVLELVKSIHAKEKKVQFKDMMISTVMPISVARELEENEKSELKNKQKLQEAPSKGLKLKWWNKNGKRKQVVEEKPHFRSFTMKRMNNVSILYADIVGFTQMSTNKTAAELVGLLNDLFGRFDKLCEETGCEKISTLGDCYYCVAGCPIENADHAKCCVEMGLGMIVAIKEFCIQNNTNVNMRVGIHTGYVLCGIVGLKRRKFDVWSNDVSLANGMEQWGIPGRIHISQQTLDFLGDSYEVEDSKLETRNENFKNKTGTTYLIVARKDKPNAEDTTHTNNSTTLDGNSENNVGTPIKLEKQRSKVYSNNVPSTEPLLSSKKRKSHLEHGGANNLQDGSNMSTSQNSLAYMIKQDQLMEYLEQHTSPFAQPGALSRMRELEDKKVVDDMGKYEEVLEFYDNSDVDHVTIGFANSSLEQSYQGSCELETRSDLPIEMCVSARYRIFVDLVAASLVTVLVFVASILLLASPASDVSWIVTFVILFALLATFCVLSALYVYGKSDLTGTPRSIAGALANWELRHVIGGLLLLFPAAVVFSHYACQPLGSAPSCSNYVIVGAVVILHFLNFDQLNTWMRTALAALIALVILALVYANPCTSTAGAQTGSGNLTNGSSARLCQFLDKEAGQRYEFIIDLVLAVVFVFFLNRHYELGYRLHYSGERKVQRIREETETQHTYVEWLLENFIPSHVRGAMKDNLLYSKTHKKVGVIFATIVNFNELYEEDYAGGMEFIRVLSELIGDVDELLNKEEFKDIEKIKTIGTTFMLASGLHPDTDQETTGPESHLARLMEFCIAMQNAVDRFNENMLNFQLILRIGFNHGEVTAGVIGTTKRLYDIWGDTVNTASRMDSTGEPGRIQVSEKSKLALDEHYNFTFLAEKRVKGKGMMKTYLMVRDDESTRKLPINPKFDYNPFC